MDITPGSSFAGPPDGSGLPQPSVPVKPGFRFHPWMAGAGAALVAAGAVGALAASLILKPGPGIDKMVPDNAGLYATVFLDPSVSQKANLVRMAHRFPDLHTDQQLTTKLNEALDKGLKDTGLTFTKDIQPWLGTRLTVVTDFATKPTAAVLFDARDDAAATATLARVRASTSGKKLSWSDSTYQGVTLSVGTDKGTTAVYAFLDHTAILADSEGIVRDIIDTDKGKRGSLLQTQDYQATVALLPSDRLVLAYVNGPALVDMLKTQASKQAAVSKQVPDSAWRQLAAFRGIGMTLAAGPDGLSGDVEVKVDATKLDASVKDALTGARRNALLPWVPQRAFGVLASSGIKTGLQSALNQTGALDTTTRDSLQQFGLLGSNGVIAHLTGDLALEVESHAAKSIDGAVLIGTNDTAGMQIFLTKLGTVAQLTAGSGTFQGTTPVARSVYRGVTITTIPVSSLSMGGFMPSFAVTGGVGIVATSPAEIRSLIDAHAAGTTIGKAGNFLKTKAATFSDPQSFLYVDVTETATAILSYVPAAQRQTYDAQVAPNLAPVKAIMVASQGQSDRLSQRVFVLIPN
jgi:hypothetical protein